MHVLHWLFIVTFKKSHGKILGRHSSQKPSHLQLNQRPKSKQVLVLKLQVTAGELVLTGVSVNTEQVRGFQPVMQDRVRFQAAPLQDPTLRFLKQDK